LWLYLFESDLNIPTLIKHDSLLFRLRDKEIVDSILNKKFNENKIYKYNLEWDEVEENSIKFQQKEIEKTIFNDEEQKQRVNSVSKLNLNLDQEEFKFFNDKTKEEFTGNKHDFYKKFNLDKSGVQKLIENKVKTVKGWKLIYNS